MLNYIYFNQYKISPVLLELKRKHWL